MHASARHAATPEAVVREGTKGAMRNGFIPGAMEKRRGSTRERMRFLKKTADLTALVQKLLLLMQTRFQTMSEFIFTKIEEMESCIDELGRSVW